MRRGTTLLLGAVLSFSTLACGDDDDDDDDVPTDSGPRNDAGSTGDAGRDSGTPGPDASIDAGGGSIDSGVDASRADSSVTPSDSGTDARVVDAASMDSSAADSGATESFAALYDGLLRDKCGTGCHVAGHRSGVFFNTPDAAYNSLVGKAAGADATGAGSECTSTNMQRVVAGNPDMSLLVKKIEPNPPCGMRMPRGGTALADAEIARVRAWVMGGARRN